MLVGFLLHLKAFRLPVSTREFLTLLEALEARVVSGSLDDFYALARTCLVQLASSFVTLVTPPTVGHVGINIRYLQRSGIPTADRPPDDGTVSRRGSRRRRWST